MIKVWTIAKTEFTSTLLSRGFLLAIFISPMIMLGSVVSQKYLREHPSTSQWRFGVVDSSGKLFPAIARKAQERNEEKAFATSLGVRRQIKTLFAPIRVTSVAGLDHRVQEEELFAYVVIGEDESLTYHTGTPTNVTLPLWLEKTLNDELRLGRVKEAGLDPERFQQLIRFIPMTRRDVNGGNEGPINLLATFGVPAAAMSLMLVLVFMSAPMLLHNILEEKQQRIWEILVSSVTPFQLLLGKLLGAVLVSMVLALFYLGGAALLANQLEVSSAVPYSLYAWFLLYQLLAVLIYGSIFSAIGAACSEIRDAQSLMMPTMLLIAVPMFGWVGILRAPTSVFARSLSLFPPATPMLMLLRIALPPGPAAWEIFTSIVLTSAFALCCVWLAGKIFRVGILAQGQTPTLRRLFSWISAK